MLISVSRLLFVCLFLAASSMARAEPAENVLTPLQQRQSEQAVDRALKWLAASQRGDGSFPAVENGQPGVTSLCVLAFLSRGHLPGRGAYGDNIDRGIDFILAHQRGDGLIVAVEPDPVMAPLNAAHTAPYNHAISALALCEAYAMTDREHADRLRAAI